MTRMSVDVYARRFEGVFLMMSMSVSGFLLSKSVSEIGKEAKECRVCPSTYSHCLVAPSFQCRDDLPVTQQFP